MSQPDDTTIKKTNSTNTTTIDASSNGLPISAEEVAAAPSTEPEITKEEVAAAFTTKSNAELTITLKPGQSPVHVDEIEKKLLVKKAKALKLFQRAGSLIRIINLTSEQASQANRRDGLKRPEGAVVLYPLTAPALLEILDRYITFQSTNAEGDTRARDCPAKIAIAYLSRVGLWNLPYLTGVIEAPILRPDGTVLSKPGYDSATGLFLDSAGAWPGIPKNPTRADAEAALKILLEPIAEFPFVSDADKSVKIAGDLTAIQRRMLESAPLIGFSAPTQRSGKSLLVESTAIMATGRIPAAAGVSKDSEELRKAITSTLREGHLIAHLDNITRPLDSPDLARAITQSIYADRLLGTNTTARLPTNVLWLATGNNLTFKGDISTRALLSRIDPEVEKPEERRFVISDLHAYVSQNRRRLVVAVLTILRAYYVAGRPSQKLQPWGGFDQWSREIREAVVWVGLPDPCKTRDRIIVADPEREIAAEILSTWHDLFPKKQMLVSEVIAAARNGSNFRQTLLMVASDYNSGSEIDARRLGAWCRSIEDRVYSGGLTLKRRGAINRAQTWEVTCKSMSCMSCMSSKPGGPNKNAEKPPAKSDKGGKNASDLRVSNSSNSSNSSKSLKPAKSAKKRTAKPCARGVRKSKLATPSSRSKTVALVKPPAPIDAEAPPAPVKRKLKFAK